MREELVPLERSDLLWAIAAGLASATLFASSLTGHAGLGDSPETVAGVSSLGILHAPGYPAYVLAAKLFTLVVPVGSVAFRVNLFSLVCAAGSIGGVQLLARRCGAARWAAAAAAVCLAASSGFVFYSGFAKHDMFSGLLMVLTVHLVLSLRSHPTPRRVIAVAVVFGLGLASSWPLEVTAAPAILFVLLAERRALSIATIVRGTAAGLLTVVALYGFVMVRAAENPRLNWGRATTLSALSNLVRRTDFTGAGQAAPPRAPNPPPSGGAAGAAGVPPPASIVLGAASAGEALTGYGTIFVDELGGFALLLACGGVLLSLRRPRPSTYPLIILFATNLVAVAGVVGGGDWHSLRIALLEEGFLLGCYFVLAIWAAIGAHGLVDALGGACRRLSLPGGRWLWRPFAIALAAAMIIPVIADSRTAAGIEAKPLADKYATSVLGQLPPDAVLIVWGAENTQPLILHQVVDHQRPDVVVVAADGLSFPWYRTQVQRQLRRRLPPVTGNAVLDAQHAVNALLGSRPVLLDPQAVEYLKGRVGYEPQGLLARAIPGIREQPVGSPAVLAANFLQAERAAGFPDPSWDRWPNISVEQSMYSTAALLVARTYYAAHDLAGMRRALQDALRIDPRNQTAQQDLALLQSRAGQ